MNEFLGQSGNIFYIINKDFNEAMSFNTYGHKVDATMTVNKAISNCSNVIPVDIISILGTALQTVGKDYSEIYFQGNKASLNSPYLSIFSALRGKIHSLGGRYYIRKEEGYVQVLILTEKNTISKEDIESSIGKKLNWSSICN